LSKTDSHLRLSGAFSVRLGSRYESSRPRNLLKISFLPLACQLPDFTGFPHRAASREESAIAQRSLLEAHRFYAAERIFLPLQRRTALAFANNQ